MDLNMINKSSQMLNRSAHILETMDPKNWMLGTNNYYTGVMVKHIYVKLIQY
jgi:hypothetical protein